MPTTAEIAARLNLTAERIAQWRADAQRLKAIVAQSLGPLEPLVLLDVEETSSAIYQEIIEFDSLLVNIDRKSHEAAGQIASVGDALRLVLMEITELGTVIYARQELEEAEPTGA